MIYEIFFMDYKHAIKDMEIPSKRVGNNKFAHWFIGGCIISLGVACLMTNKNVSILSIFWGVMLYFLGKEEENYNQSIYVRENYYNPIIKKRRENIYHLLKNYNIDCSSKVNITKLKLKTLKKLEKCMLYSENIKDLMSVLSILCGLLAFAIEGQLIEQEFKSAIIALFPNIASIVIIVGAVYLMFKQEIRNFVYSDYKYYEKMIEDLDDIIIFSDFSPQCNNSSIRGEKNTINNNAASRKE